MKLLLDTHAFIWWDHDQTQLSSAALTACLDSANSLHLSLVSIWEVQIKMQLGKLTLRLPLSEVLVDQQRNSLIIEATTVDDILGLSALPMIHRDPFDRLLISQAQHGGFHLATHDIQVVRYNVATLW